MTVRTPLLRSLLLAAVLAVAAAGCGVETSSDAGSAPTLPTAADSSSSGSSDSDSTPASPDSAPATEPDDDPVETTEPAVDGPATTEGSNDDASEGYEDGFRESLAAGFESAGLTEEQANCVADGYLEEFGTDAGSATDYTAMLDLFTACDVDLMDLGG